MRLWHENLIPKLPRQQLLGQHRECCALRGKGWGRRHATVNYVFDYSPYKLYQYHMKIMEEMKRRGYQNDPLWEDALYRGKTCQAYDSLEKIKETLPIYPEHNSAYETACLLNLKEKGVDL